MSESSPTDHARTFAPDLPLHPPASLTGNWPPATTATGPTFTYPPTLVHPDARHTPSPERTLLTVQPNLLDVYANAPRTTFPTPSELLTYITSRDPLGNMIPPDSEKKVETQRKARQRAVAESIGFPPTDP